MDNIIALLLSPGTGVVTSYPPKLPTTLIKLYDYPIFRIIMLGSILALSFYYPVVAIVLGVSFGIITEDIYKTARGSPKKEGFYNSIVDLDDDVTNDAPDRIANKSVEQFENALNLVRQAEEALQRLTKPPRRIDASTGAR